MTLNNLLLHLRKHIGKEYLGVAQDVFRISWQDLEIKQRNVREITLKYRMSSRSWLVEVGFIIFIISSYVYFLYHDAINSGIQNLYKFGASAITVSIVVTGVYYLYKNPDQIPSLLTKFLKKKA